MTIEARLQALVQNYRAQFGDAALRAPAQMIANLSSQSPDLHGEIRALAAAIGGEAASRIAAAGADGDGETARIATEIAGRERLSMAVATAGVAVARALGPIAAAAPAMPPAPSGGGGWAGESVVVQPAPQPPAYQPAPPQPGAGAYVPPGSVAPPGTPVAQPIYKNPFVIGGAVLVGLFLLYQAGQNEQGTAVQNGQGKQPVITGGGGGTPGAGGGTPGGGGGTQGGGGGTQGGGGTAQGGEPPTLAAPNSQQPLLRVERQQDGSSAIYFRIQTERGPAVGAVGLPPNGWEGATTAVGFSQPGDPGGRLVHMGSAQLQLVRAGQVTLRAGAVQWQQQGGGLGAICIAFAAQGQQQDVPINGSSLCVADASCQQPVACGRVQ